MTDREATIKAYNALHFNLPVIEDYGTKEQLEVQHNAINALDHALAQPEQEPVAPILLIENRGTPEERVTQLYTAPPKREQWTPVEIGVDVTHEGAHVVGMYALMPEAVRHVFYSQFHLAPKREWVGLTVDEILDCYEEHLDRTMFLHRVKSIEAKIKEKNT